MHRDQNFKIEMVCYKINCPPKLNNFFTHKNSIYLEASKIVKTHHNQTNTQNNHEQKIMMVCV
jgi:hypothetical protein